MTTVTLEETSMSTIDGFFAYPEILRCPNNHMWFVTDNNYRDFDARPYTLLMGTFSFPHVGRSRVCDGLFRVTRDACPPWKLLCMKTEQRILGDRLHQRFPFMFPQDTAVAAMRVFAFEEAGRLLSNFRNGTSTCT